MWSGRDWVALLAVPAVLLCGWLTSLLSEDVGFRAVTDTVVRIVLFAVLVIANRRLLARHWKAMLKAPWRSAGLIVVGMVAIQVVISLIRALLPAATGSAGETTSDPESSHIATGVLVFAALGPTVTALIEDFTFRHTLLLKLPVWSTGLLAGALVVVNALVFGLVHFNNFNGQLLLTLSYAGAGLLMNLVYLWTRNIWHVLLMHGLNNFLLAGPPMVLIAALLGV